MRQRGIDNQRRPDPAAAAAISDPTVRKVFQYSHATPYIQAYFDIAFPTDAGQALDDAVANSFAGQGTPQSIVSAVTNVMAGDK